MADSARAQRQKALADKKKRLEELKARRSQRTVVSSELPRPSANLDEYIDGLLGTDAPGGVPPSPANNVQASASPALSEEEKKTGDSAGPTSEGPSNSISDTGSSENGLATSQQQQAQPMMVAAKHAETFEMGTQTAEDDFPPPSDADVDEIATIPSDDEGGVEGQAPDSTEAKSAEDFQREAEAKVLSSEEMEREVTSQTFASFLNTTSKKVERVLGTPVLADLLYDIVGDSDGKRSDTKTTDGSSFVSSRQLYECPRWTNKRDVTDIDWSPLHRELMLTSYSLAHGASANQDAAVKAVSPDDTPSSSLSPRSGELLSDGLALVWSLAMPSRPEHIFTCGSPVRTARFHPTESHLIVGGCHSGQLVVWDVRAGRMPVQKSSLTTSATGGKGHTYPISSMEIIEGSSYLVTGSSDGRVNYWSLANLTDPAESLQIGDSVSCLGVSPESETLVCGDEFGSLYAVQSAQTTLSTGVQRSRKQVRKLDSGDEGHFGLITSISTKTQKSASRAGISKGFLRGSAGLFLTSGVDWTVKLWSPAYVDKPLLSLVSHSYDYMCDAQWSPVHPSLCATASSNGTIGLWNFANSLDDPFTGFDGIAVEADSSGASKKGESPGLNKLKWSLDGRCVAAASCDRVHVLSLAEDVIRQKGDEPDRMMAHFQSRGLLDRD